MEPRTGPSQARGRPVTGPTRLREGCRLELGLLGGPDPLQPSEPPGGFRDRIRAFFRTPKGLMQLILLGRQMCSDLVPGRPVIL